MNNNTYIPNVCLTIRFILLWLHSIWPSVCPGLVDCFGAIGHYWNMSCGSSKSLCRNMTFHSTGVSDGFRNVLIFSVFIRIKVDVWTIQGYFLPNGHWISSFHNVITNVRISLSQPCNTNLSRETPIQISNAAAEDFSHLLGYALETWVHSIPFSGSGGHNKLLLLHMELWWAFPQPILYSQLSLIFPHWLIRNLPLWTNLQIWIQYHCFSNMPSSVFLPLL